MREHVGIAGPSSRLRVLGVADIARVELKDAQGFSDPPGQQLVEEQADPRALAATNDFPGLFRLTTRLRAFSRS